jgi:acyl-[acyl-carrier-protein]-phospholipid O-acyltransferase/long-chain-fatty-acid--[acyl-carrier-protein] ligase
MLKALLRLVFRICYRIEVEGLEHFEGLGDRVLVVVNHVSFLDAALLMAYMDNEPVFAINTEIARLWWVKPLRRIADSFALDPANPMAMKALIAKIKEGRPCVIFPEGRISVTGALMKIYSGPAFIADKVGATLVPVRIEGAERSPFSRLTGGQVRRRLFPKIRVTVVAPRRLHVDPALRGKARRRAASLQLYDIMSEMVFRTQHLGATLMEALLRARGIHGWRYTILQEMRAGDLSYTGLVIGAMALGRHLAGFTERGERVGVLLPNANGSAVTFMALQAFGRVPAMLNFSTGAANMEAALVAAEVKTVLTSREFVEKARIEEIVAGLGERARIVHVEDLRGRIGTGARLRAFIDALLAHRVHAATGVGADDPAVVLFTSGSEGRPKGVVLSHANILANVAQAAARIDYNELDRCFNALPIFHSFGLTGGTLLPMLSGVPVVMYPSPLHYRIVPEVIYNTQSTIMFGTNSFLKGYGRMADPYDFRSLRYVFAGGEAIQAETSELWFEKFGIRILAGYGATETAPVLTLNTSMHYKKGTVGRFLPGIEWRLEKIEGIDEGGRLWVKGPNVMLGYLRYERPGVIEPPEDGWYDTGDIVEVDAEGFVTIRGRAKRFAKIGGEMVSLGAVEALAAAASPDAHHAAVAIEDKRKGERLVLVTTGDGLDRARLLEIARQKGSAEINVPAEIVQVKELPLLGTGKTDYPALQKLVEERLGPKKNSAPEVGAPERTDTPPRKEDPTTSSHPSA